jgi:hypothetical protein
MMQSTADLAVGGGARPRNLRIGMRSGQQGMVSVSPAGLGSAGMGNSAGGATSFAFSRSCRAGRMVRAPHFAPARAGGAGPQSKNAASTRLRGVICVSDWLSHPVLPRTPSLELSVLPNGGGQIPGLAKIGPTVYDIDGAEGDRTPDLCIANAALSQLSYSPAPALVRDVYYPIASSRCQTATAPRPSGAAVTDTNLAGHPTLSTRRRTAPEVTGERNGVARAVIFTPHDD